MSPRGSGSPGSSGDPLIAVINHSAANIHSVDKALQRAGANVIVTSSPDDLAGAAGAVLPGVGSSNAAMRALNEAGLVEPIKSYAASGRPLLGVCLGMQILFDSSEEGDLPGLGLIPGVVRRMDPAAAGEGRKIPHTGWNSVHLEAQRGSSHPLFEGTEQNSYFYFVHSFACVPFDRGDVLATTEYGATLCAAVARKNVMGTQFHPEKSQDAGLRLYRNFLRIASIGVRAAGV